MRKDVDTLRKEVTHYELMVENCLAAVQASEETHTTQVRGIKSSLRALHLAVKRLQENQDLIPPRPEPPSPRIMEAKKNGGVFLVQAVSSARNQRVSPLL
jgi:hypothetical protein